jgi:hypothetical protein
MPGQLVGSREALGAAGELAGVRLLARVRPDVSGLVLETVEGLVAQWALVGSGQVLAVLTGLTADHGRHHTDGSHFCAPLVLLDLPQLLTSSLLLGLDGRLGIQ